MNLLSLFKPKSQVKVEGISSLANFNTGDWYSRYCASKYDSAYPNIQAIANEFITIMPKVIDSNGKTVQNNPILNALYHPNQADDFVSFSEKLIVSTLVNRNTFILVWAKEDGKAVKTTNYGFKGQNIAGFTFLEHPSITRRDNKTYYQVGAETFTEDQVIVISGGVDPSNLYAGYSPTEAATQWITLDDYIADFQRGFFENNAIPAGMFVVAARTAREYNDMVDLLESRHRGAGKNGNVTYSHRPIDPTTNKPAEAQIQWIPYAQSQKDIDFAAVFEQANKRIDMAYGVSQIIKGVDDQAKYSNADVSERGFAKRVVYPRALKIYSRLTHELNRITGGIGVAITFDYEIPEIADRKKVEAEVMATNTDTILKLVDKGYELDSVIDALKLPQNYKLLKLGENNNTEIENDKPQVDEGGEVEKAPDPRTVGALKAEASEYDKLYNIAKSFMQSRVDQAIQELGAQNEAEDDNLERFIEDSLALITLLLISSGTDQYKKGLDMIKSAGLDTESTDEFVLSDTARADYRSHLTRVAKSYDDETKKVINDTLERSHLDNLSESQTRDLLRDIMNTDEYRVARLARTEIQRSESVGDVEAMKQLEAETGAEIEKTINHPVGAHCPECRALEGIWKPVAQPMIKLNEAIETDSGTWINDYEENVGGPVHPNCGGRPKFRIKQ